MEYGDPDHGPEPLDNRMSMTAHHEAGHIVVAAHCGMPEARGHHARQPGCGLGVLLQGAGAL
jgi:hypothetical protein